LRQLTALALALALASIAQAVGAEEGAPAQRARPVRSCATIARQIAHFEQIGDRAREQDEPLWERANDAHLDRLRAHQASQCPQDVPPSFLERVGRAFQTIGEAGLTALTFGAL
jgi:hypothetical protein